MLPQEEDGEDDATGDKRSTDLEGAHISVGDSGHNDDDDAHALDHLKRVGHIGYEDEEERDEADEGEHHGEQGEEDDANEHDHEHEDCG